jgi:hypothetical protein
MALLRLLLLAAALAGCVNLTAEAPLFSVADQGAPPLAEGVWIAVSEECPQRYQRRTRGFPSDCAPLEISRLPDGSWQARMRVDLVTGLSPQERSDAGASPPLHFVLAPAVERDLADSFAPIYVAEIAPSPDEHDIRYAVLVPYGPMPATSMLMLEWISCTAALREGPIVGVSEIYKERVDENGMTHQDLSRCVASSQAAVREAARRVLIENLNTMLNRRFVRLGGA